MTTQANTTNYEAQLKKLHASDQDPETKALLEWLIATAEAEKWPLDKLAGDIGTSSTTLYKLFGGTFAGNTQRALGLISAFRGRYESRRSVADSVFVETGIAKKIWQAIDYAVTYQEIVSIVGNSQWGKTTAAIEYQKRKFSEGSDAVIILRMPVNPAPYTVARMLCKSVGLPKRMCFAECMDALKTTISSRHCIIVDEMHQAATGKIRGIHVIEMLREIYDCTRCGLVLIGTNVWGRILDGSYLKEWQGVLGQTMLRGINVTLPPVLGYADQRAIWEAYGLPEPDKATRAVVQEICSTAGLGRYVKRLRAAATAATRSGKSFSWTHFVSVHNQLEQLAGGQYREEVQP